MLEIRKSAYDSKEGGFNPCREAVSLDHSSLPPGGGGGKTSVAFSSVPGC